jgi:hypothetical protein
MMHGLDGKLSLLPAGVALLVASLAADRTAPRAPAPRAPAPAAAPVAAPVVAPTGCAPDERRQALRAMQEEVMRVAPRELESLERATRPGGALAGWQLSHGHVVLATAGAVAVDNIRAEPPWPPLLLYAPSPSSAPDDWRDFDGPDGPYRLVGWAYFGPYAPGSEPPPRRCIAPREWVVHEAGWHLMDGGMRLTPGAAAEPPRPPGVDIFFWHPAIWDLHVWAGESGVPTVAFANPNERRGGLLLPEGTFFRLVDGRKAPVKE